MFKADGSEQLVLATKIVSNAKYVITCYMAFLIILNWAQK